MSSHNNNYNSAMEIVHDGWLIKSPPEKRIWKAKWRERWFVLRHSGQLPGQFVLEYYTDQSRRKLKGRIDLDQCEQVDSGIQFEGQKFNYEHVFDIKTPKRTYYLVAKTEEGMNKWVDCICAVCGLKIHVDEEFAPQHEQLLASTSTPSLTSSEASTIVASSTASTSEGEPYILMSECITGPQILNGSLNANSDILRNPSPVPPPKPGKHDRNLSGEFYDYPRPLNPTHLMEKGRTSPEPNFDDMYKIPPPVRTSDYNSEWEGACNDPWSPPPRVNWSTYPREVGLSDSVPRTEIEIVRREAQEIAHHLERLSFNDSGVESQHSSSPQEMFESIDNKGDPLADMLGTLCQKPPPRPPKPPSLTEKRRRASDKEEVLLPADNMALGAAMAYDIPPSSKGQFPPKKLPLQPHSVFFSKDDSIKADDLSPTTTVPPPPSNIANIHLDDMYDFPKQRMDVLNATVPLGKSNLRKPRKHSYANAPPGYFLTKEACVFNYEYRPSLPSGDGYLSMDANKPSETYTDMTTDGRSPTSPLSACTYLNVPPPSPGFLGPQLSDVPPAVNRSLKPGRKATDEAANSMTLPLVAPRAACVRSTSTKRSFRKPRAAPSPTPLTGTAPKLPAKNHVSTEQSTSEDELSSCGGSRRNSANDDLPSRHLVPPPPPPPPPKKQVEIQYLDLDLDSEIVQSPKSPEKPSTSTVYKTVDFVKTKAFNEMRQNVEESYRQKK